MRGKVRWHLSDYRKYGITPAYAGKRCEPTEHPHLHKDHPRLCGEKYNNSGIMYTSIGSPPPMRGKDEGNAIGAVYARITPAYAGKSIEK